MTDSLPWNRKSLLYIGLLLVSAIVLAVMFGEWMRASREFDSASKDLQRCHVLVTEISALKVRPRVASLEVESPEQTIGPVVEAQKKSQLAPQSLVSVSPSAPTRLEKTEYQVRTTELMLEQVSLDQVHRFACVLGQNEDGMVVRELSLTPETASNSNASNASERWNARLILTQLIYSPTSK